MPNQQARRDDKPKSPARRVVERFIDDVWQAVASGSESRSSNPHATPGRFEQRASGPDMPARSASVREQEAKAADVERARQQAARRLAEIEVNHWKPRQCARGHLIEVHRTIGDGPTRCPICGAQAVLEAPASVVRREQTLAADAKALLRQLWDAIEGWGAYHLDAESWTRRSEQMREAQQRADRARDGDYAPWDLG